MIFYKHLIYSFLLILCGALSLSGCFKKDAEAVPPTLADDEILISLKKDITSLEKDLSDMKKRIELSEKAIEEYALKPRLLDMSRKDFFQFDKMYRQIDQLIAYKKIKISLRERDLEIRLKNLTKKDLKAEFEEFQISLEANKPKYPWRDLEPPEYSLKSNGAAE